MSKEPKFKVGDIVSLKGYKEEFEITDWFYEAAYNKVDGWYERSNYTIKGLSTGKFIDFLSENDEDLKILRSGGIMMLPPPSGTLTTFAKETSKEEVLEEIFSLDFYDKPLAPEEVDFLLDKYNDFMNVHLLIKYMGIEEIEYKQLAEEIVRYLAK